MKYLYITIALISFQIGLAQETTTSAQDPIRPQFETLIQESNRYQDFKVVKLAKLEALKNNTSSHIASLNTEIKSLEATIQNQNSSITKLEEQLATTNESLNVVNEEKASISFLGIQLEKGTYNAIVWSIIALLVAGLVFFILQFKNSNTQTQIAKTNLEASDKELEEVRRKALEKEQKLGRMLQDERNKMAKIK